MAGLKLTAAHFAAIRKIDPSGALEDAFKRIVDAQNNVALQVNAAPVGKTPAPPPISSVQATAAGGAHSVVITDNNKVSQGIIYHFEYSASPNFPTQQTYLAQSGPSKSLTGFFLGKGKFYWRAFSQYQASAPSKPVLFGTASAPTAIDAGGTIATATPPAATGSGTDQGVLPKGGQGFGQGFQSSQPNRGANLKSQPNQL